MSAAPSSGSHAPKASSGSTSTTKSALLGMGVLTAAGAIVNSPAVAGIVGGIGYLVGRLLFRK